MSEAELWKDAFRAEVMAYYCKRAADGEIPAAQITIYADMAVNTMAAGIAHKLRMNGSTPNCGSHG